MGRFQFIENRQHALSFGVSGSSYVLNTAPLLAIPSSSCPQIWRFRFLICHKHAPSSCDSGSSYIHNTPPHLANPVHHISTASPLISDVPFSSSHLKHTCIVNTPPHLAVPVHHISTTRPLIGDSGSSYIHNTPRHSRLRFVIYLQHVPSFGDYRFIICL